MNKMKKILYGIGFWFISLTWGALMTIPGLIVTAFCIIFLHGKPHKNGFSYIVEVGGNWGGLELGAVALCGHYYGGSYWDEVRSHEFGHSIQNLYLGPLFPFLVGIPSASRYWYERYLSSKKIYLPASWYDCNAWFEYYASKYGVTIINKIENTNIIYEYADERKKVNIKEYLKEKGYK